MKRVIPIALILALLLAIPAMGATGLSFVAFNDTIPMVLSAGQAPCFVGGVFYVPHTVFAASVAGFHLSYGAGDQYLTLYSGSRHLVFDLEHGTVVDEKENVYYVSALGRNGYIYLPAQFCAQYFGVGASYLTSRDGYAIVRFTNGGQVYDDNYFVDVAQNFIAYQVEQVEKPVAPPPPTPVSPTPTKPEEPPKPQPEPEEPANVYIGILGGENLEETRAILEKSQYDATVFLTPDQVESMGNDLRKFSAHGGTYGILAEDWQDVVTANEGLVAQGLPATLLVAASEDLGDGCKTIVIPGTLKTPEEVAENHGETDLLWIAPNLVESAVDALKAEEAVTMPLRENTIQS